MGNWKYESQAKDRVSSNDFLYEKEIKYSVENTHVYDVMPDPAGECKELRIIVEESDSVSAIFSCRKENPDKRVAVLNFASYKNPGGGFLSGAMAQEEALCHSSTLYNVLREFESSYYDYNRNNLNFGMYTDRALYSKDIIFSKGAKGNEIKCDVLTCAAPNKSICLKYGRPTERQNSEALASRIDFLISVAEQENVDVLILGAFGCGVFRQDATEVARLFKERLESRNTFEQVIFAIPDRFSSNYQAFAKVFSRR